MSIFKDLTDKVAKEDSVTHPAAATGWPVDVETVLLQQLADPSFRSMNGMGYTEQGDLKGDTGKIGIGVMIKDPTSKKPQLLVNPKIAGSLNSGPGGQTIPKNNIADPSVTAHFDLVYHGANNTAPVVYSYSEMHRGNPAEGSGNYTGPNLPRQNMAVSGVQDGGTKEPIVGQIGGLGTGTKNLGSKTPPNDNGFAPVDASGLAIQMGLPKDKPAPTVGTHEPIIGTKIPPNVDSTGKQTPIPINDGLGVVGNSLRTGTTVFKSIRGGAGFFNDLIKGPSN